MSKEYEVPLFKPGVFQAGADLSGDQFLAMKLDADGDVSRQASAGAAVIGILQNKPVENEAVEMEMAGICKAMIGDTVTNAFTELMVEATTGRLVPATSTNLVVAYALQGGLADGDIAAVFVLGLKGYVKA